MYYRTQSQAEIGQARTLSNEKLVESSAVLQLLSRTSCIILWGHMLYPAEHMVLQSRIYDLLIFIMATQTCHIKEKT